MLFRIQLSESEPAPAAVPAPEPLIANDQICASKLGASVLVSERVTLAVSVFFTTAACTLTLPVSAVTFVPAPSILASISDTISLVAEAKPIAAVPAPEPAPATMIINGLVVANRFTSSPASTSAPPVICALTTLRIKLIDTEPAKAAVPAPAPPTVTLIISALARALTFTSPSCASTVAPSMYDNTYPAPEALGSAGTSREGLPGSPPM